jgi:hypothetical protein
MYKLEVLMVLVILGTVLYTCFDNVSFHPDEALEIYMSRSFEFFFEFDLSLWGENFWTLTQPKLTNYIVAIGRLAAGYGPNALPCYYDFSVDYQTNLANGCVPKTDLLLAARMPMVFLSVLSLVGLYWIIMNAAGRPAAIFFLIYFLVNPASRDIFLRAKGEAPLLFFMVVLMILTRESLRQWHNYAQKPQFIHLKRKAYGYFITVGIMIGLAGSVRINGSLLGFSVSLLFLLENLTHPGQLTRQEMIRQTIRVIFVLFSSALLTFVVLNPYLYSAPLTNMGRILKWRSQEFIEQSHKYPDEVVPGGIARWPHVIRRIFFDLSSLPSTTFAYIQGSLALAGLILAIRELKQWYTCNSELALSWAVIVILPLPLVFSGLLTPLDYDRYYIFAVVYRFILSSIALGVSLNNLWSMLSKKFSTSGDDIAL